MDSGYLKQRAAALLNRSKSGVIITENEIKNVMQIMNQTDKTIRCERNGNNILVYDRYYHDAECRIADEVFSLVQNKPQQFTNQDIDNTIDSFQQMYHYSLSDDQRLAVRTFINNRFSIITGGAGTGKTTVLKYCVAVFTRLCKGTVTLAAPTGRAARRLAEATGIVNASTLHSLLGITKDMNFREEVTPSQIETDAIFLDEASMCEIGMFYKMLRNASENTRFVLIGDPNSFRQ